MLTELRTCGRTSLSLALVVILGSTVRTAPAQTPTPDPAQAPLPTKSIGIYVGGELTDDGSVLLGGFGHESSGHWHEVVPAQTHPEGAMIEVGVTEDTRIPGDRFEIPQERETARYIGTNYSEWAGFPPPLTNGGLNEHGVAARDIWSPSREELVEMTPTPQTGPNYSDLARIAMERATSAREAVEIVGGLIDEHGYSTYGGNSHLFADAEEGWVFINYAGGQGLWAAERIPSDAVRVSYPGYIGEFPVEFHDDADFMASENLVDFAVEQGWWDPADDEPFDLQEAYGRPFPSRPDDDPLDLFRYPPLLEEEIEGLSPVALEDMLALVRDPRWSDDASGYGHVAHLRPDVHPELQVLWMSITGAVASPFVPVHVGVEDVPPEYKQHRYMGKGAASQFLNPDFAPLEATRSAFRVHKRLLYHTCENPEAFLRPVTAELEAFEGELLDRLGTLEEEVRLLYDDGDASGARERLTLAAEAHFLEGLELGEALVEEVERRTREELGGIRMPTGDTLIGATWRPESQDMNLEAGFGEGEEMHVRCYRPGLETYPRVHRGYDEDRFLDDRAAAGQGLGLGGGGPSAPGAGPITPLLVLLAVLVGGSVGWTVRGRH